MKHVVTMTVVGLLAAGCAAGVNVPSEDIQRTVVEGREYAMYPAEPGVYRVVMTEIEFGRKALVYKRGARAAAERLKGCPVAEMAQVDANIYDVAFDCDKAQGR